MARSRAQSLALARSVSEFGNSMRFIAFPLGVLRVANNPQHLATVELLETISAFAAGLLVPFFIDRFSRRTNLVVADLFSLLITALMAYGVYLESLPILLGTAVAISAVYIFHEASLTAATADLTSGTSDHALIQGFSRLQLYTLTFGLIGSLAGAAIVKQVPLYALFAADALSFLVSSIWIYRLIETPVQEIDSKRPANHKVTFAEVVRASLQEWKGGYRLAWGDLKTRQLIAAQGIVAIGHGLLASTVISHYKTTLRISDSQVALAQANNRVWQFGGALLRLKSEWSPRKGILFGATLMALGYFTMAWVPFGLFLIAYGIQQFGNSVLTPTNRAVVMGGIQSEYRGRVAAFRGLVIDLGILLGNTLSLIVLSTASTSWNFTLAGLALLVALKVYASIFNSTDDPPESQLLHSKSSTNTNKEDSSDFLYSHHLVAFIDLLGQKDKLCEIEGVLNITRYQTDQEKLKSVLRQTLGSVWRFREHFADFINSYVALKPTINVSEEIKERFQQLRGRAQIKFQSFSDSTIIWTPIHVKTELDYIHILNSIYGVLGAVGLLTPLFLTMRIPYRGGIDIEGGIAITPGGNEI